MNKIKRIKGTQDVLPGEVHNWQKLEAVIHSTMSIFNYREMRTPVFESTELFARGIGRLTDIVSKEMYSFEDRGKKQITLKPEMTAPIIRAYLEHNLKTQAPLQKVYYISSLFRQENPQAGRLRQFNQFGAEAIGADAAELDTELIQLALAVFAKLGIEGLKLEINTVGDTECREPYKIILKEYLRPVLDQYCEDCRKRFDGNPLRILDCKKENCRTLNRNAPKLSDHLCSGCDEHFTKLQDTLRAGGIAWSHNPYLVRGLDYYTRTVFEITSSDLGSQNAICGGGRYDLLAEQLGGPPTAAVGFAAGIERTLMVMGRQGLLSEQPGRLQVFVAPLGDAAAAVATEWVTKLRAMGYRTDRDYLGRSVKAQMREANRQRAQMVFLLGDEELKQKNFSVKEMDNGTQKSVSFSEIGPYLSDFFKHEK